MYQLIEPMDKWIWRGLVRLGRHGQLIEPMDLASMGATPAVSGAPTTATAKIKRSGNHPDRRVLVGDSEMGWYSGRRRSRTAGKQR